jgi:carboxylesterase type B
MQLTIAVPPGADVNSKLPVMFWIFGGGYQIGTFIHKIIHS